MNADKLYRYCKQGHVKVELHCQLALMPVCYLSEFVVPVCQHPHHTGLISQKSPKFDYYIFQEPEQVASIWTFSPLLPPSTILQFSSLTAQRRYVVNTFQISCFRRSELTLQRYMLLKFIYDTCSRYHNEIPREKRDVHWLVEVYLEDYAAVFGNRQRPRLHRSEVYDHFATHAKWLRKVLRKKALVDRTLWEQWMDDSTMLKRKARKRKSKWGARLKRRVVRLKRPVAPKDEQSEHEDSIVSFHIPLIYVIMWKTAWYLPFLNAC